MAAMKVATFNGCKVYNLSTGKTMPQWLSENKRRMLSKDDDYRRRLELIQDFEMPTAAQTIKMTKDGEHIVVCGTYPPSVKCYTVSDMSMKFQRGLTCDVVACESLSEDFGKMVFLQSDRTLNFHAPYGTHYSVRVPKFGRDLNYNWNSCDLFVSSSGEEVYRLNLETGMFKEPLTLGYSGCNKMHLNPVHPLLACGGESSICEFWDVRNAKKSVASLQVDRASGTEITALQFDTDGMTLAAGTSNGLCILYDIRSSKPLFTKEHQYGLPVKDVKFHNDSRHIISTDKKIVKIWERDGPNVGKILTNIETPVDINDIHVVADRRGQSGLIMMAGEQSRIMTYFVPQLGPAPRWCSFLEGLTEELEEASQEGAGTVYEDYKFVTKLEVEELGATGLIGTPMLRGYMHGFFMEMKLYSKLRAVSKPFEYEEHRKKKIRDKIEEKRASRITAQKRLPKVNAALAEKMTKLSKKEKKEKETESENALVDPRFASLFSREEFEQDETSLDFKLRNPTRGQNRKSGDDDDENDELVVRDLYSSVETSGGKNNYDDYDDEDSDGYVDSEDDDIHQDQQDDYLQIRNYDDEDEGEYSSNKKSKLARKNRGNDVEEEGMIAKASKKIIEKRKNAGPSMYELKEGVSSATAALSHTVEGKRQRKEQQGIMSVPLSRRLESDGSMAKVKGYEAKTTNAVSSVATGDGMVREMSYVPKDSKGHLASSSKTTKRHLDDQHTGSKNADFDEDMRSMNRDNNKIHHKKPSGRKSGGKGKG